MLFSVTADKEEAQFGVAVSQTNHKSPENYPVTEFEQNSLT